MSKEEKINILTPQFELHITQDTEIVEWHFPSFPFICNLYVEDHVQLKSKQILDLEHIQGSIHIYSQDDTRCQIQLGIRFQGENHLEIVQHMNQNHSKSTIRLRVFQQSDHQSELKTLGIIAKDTVENEFLEDIRVLTLFPSKIICKPDLIVESHDAIANHNVTIRTILDDELFYFECRGISKSIAQECFVNGFIQSMLN